MHMPLLPEATTYQKHLDHIYNLHTQTFIRTINITHVYDYVLLLLSMGWLRLVVSSKSKICFAKEPYIEDNILQKRPINFSFLVTADTPYHSFHPHI